jgi:hypothetical protein
MKSKELIKLLQKADPTGETEVFVDNIDIYSVYKEEMYWDGKPQLLIRDNSKLPYYNIVSGKICYRGDKISIKTLSIEDALVDHPDMPVDLSEVPEHSIKEWERAIERWRNWEEEEK